MAWLLLVPAIALLALYSKSKNAVWGGATIGTIIGLMIAIVRPGFQWDTVMVALSIGTFVGTLSDWLPQVIAMAEGNRREAEKDPSDSQTTEELRAELVQKKRDLQLLEDPETIYSFGQMAYEGDGVEQSYVEAANWYRIAAEAGNARAQHNLSLMYEIGEGVDKDDLESLRWCMAAAKQGHAGSQNNLGVRFETGDGVRKDLLEAFRWYKKAAANGDENGRENWLRAPAEVHLKL